MLRGREYAGSQNIYLFDTADGNEIKVVAQEAIATANARTINAELALGFAAGLAWVPHPIQNRTPAELAGIADATIDSILALIRR